MQEPQPSPTSGVRAAKPREPSRDDIKTVVSGIPLSWAFESECRILMFMWCVGPSYLQAASSGQELEESRIGRRPWVPPELEAVDEGSAERREHALALPRLEASAS